MTIAKLVSALRAPVLGLLFGLGAISLCLKFSGESPFLLLHSFRNAFFTGFGLGYTLFYATPLIFTGLAVALSFHCGLFNIGGEGQLYVGALAVAMVPHFFPGLPWPLTIILGIIAAFLAGGLWGGLAGLLKAWRGSHEVIVTILLNFVAYSLVDYCILYPLRNPAVQNSETAPIPVTYTIPYLHDVLKPFGIEAFTSTPVNMALGLAVVAAIVSYLFLFRTSWGFELRTVGQNPVAARFAGISPARSTILALALSGGMAGLEGVNEVMGSTHKLIQGFSADYGFTGIAVALAARNQPFGILISALLFGGLQTSAREIEFMSDKVSKELGFIIQAILIAFVASDYWLEKWMKGRSKSQGSSWFKTLLGRRHSKETV
jgi:ABC-type uncharacterized transport system permease subunit